MEEFEQPIDKIIREARDKGEFDHLPGKGKPIRWEDETLVPDEQRLVNRVLKNNSLPATISGRRTRSSSENLIKSSLTERKRKEINGTGFLPQVAAPKMG